MKKFSYISLVLGVFLLGSCKDFVDIPVDKNYPTTIYKLSTADCQKAYKDYIARNQYITSDIDSFGFCSLTKNRNDVAYPHLKKITKEEAIKIVKDFIAKNPKETGISDASKVNLNFSNETFTYDGSQLIVFISDNQIVSNVELLFSPIVFHVYNGYIRYCRGNWYDKVYIPNSFSVDSIKAKSNLKNRVMTHYDIAGKPYYVKITTADLEKSTSKLKIYPIKDAKKIELRVTWEINIPTPVYYKIYIDVMTGEIIAKEPTIIS